MCGIIGVVTPNKGGDPTATRENLEILLLGMKYLHRRGPEGQGVGFINPSQGTIISAKANSDKEKEEFEATVKRMAFSIRGTMSLGQTRYITDARFAEDGNQLDKEKLEANTQPQHLSFDDVGLEGLIDEGIMVHNGNIRDKGIIKRMVEKAGHISDSIATVDSRYLAELMIQRRRVRGNNWDASRDVMKTLYGIDGAASWGFSDGKYLVAGRDPRGYRPLVFGSVRNSRVFVSESGFFREATAVFGSAKVHYGRSVRPGEILLMDKDGHFDNHLLFDVSEHGGCTRQCPFEDVYMKDYMSHCNQDDTSAGNVRITLGMALVRRYWRELEGIDAVVPVPRSGISPAEGVAQESGKPYRDLLRKPVNDADARFFLDTKTEKKHRFVVDSAGAYGANLAVIDDSVMRGETAVEMYADLKDAGAKSVKLFSIWPPTFFHCDYGIDTESKELIANMLIQDGTVKYERGRPVQYDIDLVNREITKLLRAKVIEKYRDKYGDVSDLEVFYGSTDMLQENLTTKTHCLYCVTGQRDDSKSLYTPPLPMAV